MAVKSSDYLDYFLLPALGIFIGITVDALVRRCSGTCDETCAPGQPKPKWIESARGLSTRMRLSFPFVGYTDSEDDLDT